MTHFPLFLDLKGREVLIFGGGAFAMQRIEKLMPFSPKLTVISAEIDESVKKVQGVRLIEREFCTEDLECSPAFVVIAEDEKKTAFIYEECKKRSIPVNAVDMPRYCDIIFPSVIATEHLCIGISSGGLSPIATVVLKEEIEKLIPDDVDTILERMLELREEIKRALPPEKRKNALRAAFKEMMGLQTATEEERP